MSKEESKKIDVQAATLVGTLRDNIISISKNHGDWKKLPEAKQRDIAHAAEQLAKDIVRRCAHIIAGRGFKSMHALLQQVTVKDGIKMVLTSSKDTEAREDLLDAQGGGVTIVLSDISPYMRERAEPEIDPDQPELPINAEKPKKKRGKKNG